MSRRDHTVEESAALVRLHERTLRMNGDKIAPVLVKEAERAVAEYEAALAKQQSG